MKTFKVGLITFNSTDQVQSVDLYVKCLLWVPSPQLSTIYLRELSLIGLCFWILSSHLALLTEDMVKAFENEV